MQNSTRPPNLEQKRAVINLGTWLVGTFVTAFWALLVSLLMALGAYLFNVPTTEIPAIAILGAAGAAIYVIFFS
jgi:hypothetical protein